VQVQKSFKNEKANLYIIPTPIGNLEDMTLRSINIIKNEIDVLLCEDTRVTKKLLNKYEIKIETSSYHEFNKEKVTQKYINEMNCGKNFGLVSDAGMPGISDPGYDLIREAKKNNINVIVLPGASAFLVALVRSNFPNEKFTYLGFLSASKSKKKKELKSLLCRNETSVFYESPHKIVTTLNLMCTLEPDRAIFIAREMTKLNEEYITCNVSEAVIHFENVKPKGEFVIVVEPSKTKDSKLNLTIEESVEMLIKQGVDQKEAIKIVAKERKVKKNEVYKLFIKE